MTELSKTFSKIWHLKPRGTSNGWGEVLEFIVEAPSSTQARRLAAEQHEDEGKEFWLDSTKSSCYQMRVTGESRVIICSSQPG